MKLEWESEAEHVSKVEEILKSWLGTKYVLGCQKKGVGVDCVRFVCGVLDELYFGQIKQGHTYLPPDRALNSPETAWKAMRQIVKRYDPVEFESYSGGTMVVRPGDALITGPSNGGPGHCMIVGPKKPYLWHSLINYGVCFTGLSLTDGTKLFGRYRRT